MCQHTSPRASGKLGGYEAVVNFTSPLKFPGLDDANWSGSSNELNGIGSMCPKPELCGC
jgi:hypothetical protein